MSVTRAPLIPGLGRLALDSPITHAWDDDDPLAGIGVPDAQTEALLGAVSDWGKLVYVLGCADWVLARFGRFIDADWPWLFRDACWAFEFDPAYMLPREIEDHPQEGPVDGPVCLVLTTVLNTRYGFDEGNAQIDAAVAEQIVLHVLPNSEPFTRWRDTVLGRLVKVSAGIGTPTGERLSMAVLDDDTRQVSPSLRPSPEELRRLALDGNPYARRLADFRR